MNFLITESQKSSIRGRISKSINHKGIWQTIEDFKLNLKTLDVIFKDKMPELDCSDLNDLIGHLIYKKIVKTENLRKGDYSLYFQMDDLAGSLYFKITNLEHEDSLDGYGTPFWDGECKLPIDLEYYSFIDENDDIEDHNITDQYFKSISLRDKKFSKFSEIKEWFENDYIKILIDFCEPIFEELRDE